MIRSNRPTLRDVARLSGVSEISVSRVMRNAPNISANLRARVEAAALELGYTPNRLAGGLKSQSSNLVAVIIPSMSNSVFPEVVDGIEGVLSAQGRRTVLGLTHYDPDHEEGIIRDLLSWVPAGIILAGLEHSPAGLRMLKQAGIPVVEIMDVDGATDAGEADDCAPVDLAIGISHSAAGRAMADHLIARGYRRIGFIGAWGGSDTRAQKRQLAFEKRLTEHGVSLASRLIAPEPSSIGLGRACCARLLEAAPALEALFFANDDLAVGGLMHCMAAGIAVPERLALAGFNGIDFADEMPQRLTTIRTPRRRMGEAAAQALLDHHAGRARKGAAALDLGFALLDRDTT